MGRDRELQHSQGEKSALFLSHKKTSNRFSNLLLVSSIFKDLFECVNKKPQKLQTYFIMSQIIYFYYFIRNFYDKLKIVIKITNEISPSKDLKFLLKCCNTFFLLKIVLVTFFVESQNVDNVFYHFSCSFYFKA